MPTSFAEGANARTLPASGPTVSDQLRTRKKVLIVGPDTWTTEHMTAMKEFLDERNIVAKTLCADEGITLDLVKTEIQTVEAVVLVLGGNDQNWCNRNSARLSLAAQRASVRFQVISGDGPLKAEDVAARL